MLRPKKKKDEKVKLSRESYRKAKGISISFNNGWIDFSLFDGEITWIDRSIAKFE
jgi:hypothetical protein